MGIELAFFEGVRGRVEREWGRNETLFRQGEESVGLIVLLSGRVRVSRASPEGRRHVLHEEGAGGALGEVPLFSGGGMAGTAVAMERTTGLVIPPDVVRREIAESPGLAEVLLGRLASRTRALAERLERITTCGVRTRLALVLLDRSHRAAGAVFSLGMTQRELAEELGTVREVVVRELAGLTRRGVLTAKGGGRYVVADRAELFALAGPRVEQ